MKLLVVVDMQVDFVTGALGTQEAQAIVPAVTRRVAQAAADGDAIVFTQDTHERDYLKTQEGQFLPVPHCIRGSEGWQLIPELRALALGRTHLEKPAFGSTQLSRFAREGNFDCIELIGVCTDICVISNALLLKAYLPETPISVNASCCAGVTPDSHENALRAMKMCQILIEEGEPK